MDNGLHFISGLPRSASTLLAALGDRQWPILTPKSWFVAGEEVTIEAVEGAGVRAGALSAPSGSR